MLHRLGLIILVILLTKVAAFAQEPIIRVSATQVCVGEVVRLTASGCPATVVWMNGREGMTLVDTLRTTTVYTAKCQSGNTTLFSFPTTTLTALPRPAMPYLFCNKDQIKPGETTSVTVFGCEGTVRWNSGQVGRTIQVSPSVTTTYTAICYNAAGCGSEPISRTIIVTDPKNPPQDPPSSWRYGCQGEPVLMKAAGCTDGTYVWYKNTLFGSNVVRSEEIGRGPSVEVTQGGPDTYYTAKCQVSNCLGDESNRLFVGYVTSVPAPQVIRELTLGVGGTVDLTTALAKPYLSGGIYEFRKENNPAATRLTDPTKIIEPGTYYVWERSRQGNCLSPSAVIVVKTGSSSTIVLRETLTQNQESFNAQKNGAPSMGSAMAQQQTDTGALIVADKENDALAELEIPEAFSPNGDGVNDLFIIKKTENLAASLRIYNRFGHLVYDAPQFTKGWDGSSNVASTTSFGLPDGTYYYLLRLSDGRQKLGFVTMAR